jgi:hypothetical protein
MYYEAIRGMNQLCGNEKLGSRIQATMRFIRFFSVNGFVRHDCRIVAAYVPQSEKFGEVGVAEALSPT